MADTSNMARFWKVHFEEICRLTGLQRFVEADQMCLKLLREPALPLLYRAECNNLLAQGNENPVDCAREAVRLYEFMFKSEEVQNNPVEKVRFQEMLDKAKASLENAQKRQAEASDTDTEDEGEAEEGEEAAVGQDVEETPREKIYTEVPVEGEGDKGVREEDLTADEGEKTAVEGTDFEDETVVASSDIEGPKEGYD